MLKILYLSFGAFALGVDAYIMAGLLPHIGSTFHVSVSVAGQTVSAFTVCYAISAPVFGALVAGKPVKLTLSVALGIFALANAASALSGNFPLLLLSRAVAGIGAGLFSPLAVSAAASMVDSDRRGRAIGMVVGGLAMGTAVGVPVGLLLAERFGWRGTMGFVTLLGALASVGLALAFPNVPPASPPSFKQRVSVLADRRVLLTVSVSFFTAVATIGLYTYVAAICVSAGYANNVMSSLWAWSLGGLVGIYLVGIAIDRTSRPDVAMAVMLVITAFAIGLLPWLLSNAPLRWAAFLFWGLGAWGSQAPQQHRLLSLRPKHGSIAVALHSSAHYLGSAIGAALGGVALAGGLSIAHLPFFATAILIAIVVVQIGIVLQQSSALLQARTTP